MPLKFKKSLVIILLVVISSIVILEALLLFSYLNQSAEQFKTNFIHLNRTDFATGNGVSISHKLQNLTVNSPMRCISIIKNNKTIYSSGTKCDPQILEKKITIDRSKQGGLIVAMTIGLPPIVLTLILVILAILILVVFISLFTQHHILNYARLLEVEKEKKESAQFRAVAQTIQMLAHDVRKPFSMVRSLLGIMESTKDSSKLPSLVSTYSPEIDKAIFSVNGMISDIMEVGSDTPITTEAIDPKTLLSSILHDIFHYDNKSDIQFRYSLKHSSNALVHQSKITRVFSNIISNATQAMMGKGKIWLNTKNIVTDGNEFIEFTIGNSGSHIPQDDIANLFDSFYTKNKASGTGLGLAIAKKVVNSHGGNISCKSSKEVGVEFVFTVKADAVLNATKDISLPTSSKDICM